MQLNMTFGPIHHDSHTAGYPQNSKMENHLHTHKCTDQPSTHICIRVGSLSLYLSTYLSVSILMKIKNSKNKQKLKETLPSSVFLWAMFMPFIPSTSTLQYPLDYIMCTCGYSYAGTLSGIKLLQSWCFCNVLGYLESLESFSHSQQLDTKGEKFPGNS